MFLGNLYLFLIPLYNLFYIFFWLILTFAIIAILASNIYYSVIALLIVYFLSGWLMILMGAEYMGLTFIIIYIGAIAILFIFVIMLFNYVELQRYSFLKIKLFLILLSLFGLVELILWNGNNLFISFIGLDIFINYYLLYEKLVFFTDPLIYFSIYVFNFYFFYIIILGGLLCLVLILIILLLAFELEKNQNLQSFFIKFNKKRFYNLFINTSKF